MDVEFPPVSEIALLEDGDPFQHLEFHNTAFDSDEAIARELQLDENRSFNEQIKKFEVLKNGNCSVQISYKNFLLTDVGTEDEQYQYEDDDYGYTGDWDKFDAVDRKLKSIPARGYLNNNGNVITKHDKSLNGQLNMKKLLNFPPHVQTGDAACSDMEISNGVLNGLKRRSYGKSKDRKDEPPQSKHKNRKNNIIEPSFFKQLKNQGLDDLTCGVVQQILIGESPYLKSVNGKISEGKEAVIFHATGAARLEIEEPCECVLKVYKITNGDFRTRDQYIKDDYRFKDIYNNKMSKKKITEIWAMKEMFNLQRMKKHGIPCPDVLDLKNNVLMVSFIGQDQIAAPQIKDARLTENEYSVAYEQVVNYMKDLFMDAELIHADLSEYNILWHQGKCYFVDVSQAVETAHKMAFEFLRRDCENITQFFKRKRVEGIMSHSELFKYITDKHIDDVSGIKQLHNECRKRRQADGKVIHRNNKLLKDLGMPCTEE